MSNSPKPLSGIIGQVMAKLGLSRSYNGWMVVSQWPEIVGAQIARNARAIRFSEGVLFVAVANDSWRQELSLQRDTLLNEIRRLPYGSVVDEIRLIRGEKGQ